MKTCPVPQSRASLLFCLNCRGANVKHLGYWCFLQTYAFRLLRCLHLGFIETDHDIAVHQCLPSLHVTCYWSLSWKRSLHQLHINFLMMPFWALIGSFGLISVSLLSSRAFPYARASKASCAQSEWGDVYSVFKPPFLDYASFCERKVS